MGGTAGDGDPVLRDIRASPFAWQHLDAYALLLGRYDGQSRATAIGVYCTLTYLASAQHTPTEARAFVATIAETVGLGRSTVRRYLGEFEELGILTVERSMIGGRLNDMNRYMLVTPPASGRGAPAKRPPPPSASGSTTPTTGRQPQEQIREEENHHQQAPAPAGDPVVVELSEELVREGIDPRTAVELVAEAGPDLVDAWLAVDTWRAARNPAAVLIAHLRRRDPAPPPPETTWERYRRERGGTQRGAD